MNSIELNEKIAKSGSDIFCLVGKNATGKTYFLTSIFNTLKNTTLFIDENNIARTNIKMGKVSISGTKYIYDDSEKRGTDGSYLTETSLISNETLIFIEKLKQWQKLLDTAYKSLGSRKLLNIISSFLTYNLDNIDFFLFDEPEASLDDENIKILVAIFKELMSIGKKIVFVSHSPRFLELLNLRIDDIYIFSSIFGDIKNVNYGQVMSLYLETCDEINPIIDSLGLKLDRDIVVYKKDSYLIKIIIDDFLSSIYFYRTLFYKDIFLIEGESEEYLVKQLYSEEFMTYNFYATHGKYFMPFFIKFFSLIVEKVYCFYDTDLIYTDKNLAKALTEYIQKLESPNVCLIGVESNLENYLEIDIDKVVTALVNQKMDKKFTNSFAKCYKSLIVSYSVQSNPLIRKKAIDLFKKKTATTDFEIWS